jgi:hypothetical protein
MCSPEIAAGFQVAGIGMQVAGALNEGKSQKSYYDYLAGQNETEAAQTIEAANKNVGMVSRAAGVEEINLNRNVAEVRGTQMATLAASGVWAGSGTAEDISRDTTNKAELDRAAIRMNADLKSQQIALEAANRSKALREQSIQFKMAGANALQAAGMNAAGSILSGAGQVASSYYKWNQTSKGSKSDNWTLKGKI